jgi:hypothetical protein
VRRTPLVVVPLLLALGLTGCTGAGDDDAGATSGTSAGGAEAAAPGAQDAAPPQPAADAGTATSEPLGRAALAGAALIRTAQLGVQVDDVRAAADRAVDIAVAATGVVTSEQSSGQGRYGDASLVLRVPPDRFDAVLDDLAALGEELTRTVGTEDVTDQVVDLESRLATQRASVERVRALLEQAANLTEVVQIEAELTRRTADLESLQARLAALTERVEMSTITLELSTDANAPVEDDADALGFADGLRGGWSALLATARVLGATVGALLPFLPLLVAAGLAWRWRARRATAAPTT